MYSSAAYGFYTTATILLGKDRVMNITIQLYVVDWREWKWCKEKLSFQIISVTRRKNESSVSSFVEGAT